MLIQFCGRPAAGVLPPAWALPVCRLRRRLLSVNTLPNLQVFRRQAVHPETVTTHNWLIYGPTARLALPTLTLHCTITATVPLKDAH